MSICNVKLTEFLQNSIPILLCKNKNLENFVLIIVILMIFANVYADEVADSTSL